MQLLDYIVEQISNKNPLHSKKIKKSIKKYDDEYFTRVEVFLTKYQSILELESKSIDYAIDCYLEMLADFNFETINFIKSGKYSSSSFEEVNKRVYSNPKIMEYHMHGLLLSQFLWKHHYNIFMYFNEIINQYSKSIQSYLEVGGGHGLYISEAINTIPCEAKFDLLDISKSSLDIANRFLDNKDINYIHTDILKYNCDRRYDFISMGEVLEHVEEPIKLLEKLYTLLDDNGTLFITTPTNAPAIDHIYLFRNAIEIREVITAAGFDVVDELCEYSEDLPLDIIEKYKISMMYAAVLKKNKNNQ